MTCASDPMTPPSRALEGETSPASTPRPFCRHLGPVRMAPRGGACGGGLGARRRALLGRRLPLHPFLTDALFPDCPLRFRCGGLWAPTNNTS